SNQASQLLLGRRLTFAADTDPTDPEYVAAGDALAALDKLAAGVTPGAPWRAAQAGKWSRTTLAAFRDGQLDTKTSRGIFDLSIRTALGSDPEELSLLTALAAVAGAGDPATPGSAAR